MSPAAATPHALPHPYQLPSRTTSSSAPGCPRCALLPLIHAGSYTVFSLAQALMESHGKLAALGSLEENMGDDEDDGEEEGEEQGGDEDLAASLAKATI